MRAIYNFGALFPFLTPGAHALYETTYHSTSLAIQPFTILQKSPSYDPDNTTLFLVCPVGTVVDQPGPTIYTSTGDLVWSNPSLGGCEDFNIQTFNGQQYLTMWLGSGSAVTALVTAFNTIPLDLTSVGGPADGFYANSIVQEIDIATNRVLFNWTSVDHIALSESYNNISQTGEGSSAATAWDAVHVNSIDKDSEGNYLISSRNCQTLYKVDKSGAIVWRLGGKMSDFVAQGNGTDFHWQHHARWRTDGTQISVFDDGAATIGNGSIIVDEPIATGKYLNVDQTAMTVSLASRFFPSPSTGFSVAEGSIEPYGNTVVVGYGSNPWVEAYDIDTATALFSAVIGPNNASIPLGGVTNYRVFQTSTLQFTGHPTQLPAVALINGTVYVSWNGATHVASYTLLTGSETGNVSTPVRNVAKSGFETAISATGSGAYISVAALAANGTTLGRGAIYKTSDGTAASR
ncbi:ASST-domain-containing protein [Mycena sanguinolenta]|nr:ASST-domain-containing protein [Mycena sanguinolenta]